MTTDINSPIDVKPPETGRQTQQQPHPAFFSGGLVYSGGIVSPNMIFDVNSIGTATNFANIWPGWGSLLTGSYWTYRTMMRHHTVGYVMSQVLNPLLGSDWVIDADKDAPKEATDWLRENVIQHRPTMMPHLLRSVVFGNAPFENVWRNVKNQFVIDEYVPLSQDITSVLRDPGQKNKYMGLQNMQEKLPVNKCIMILNKADVMGAEPGNDYGRSRLENVRDTAWVGWLDSARRLAELEDRVSGILPIFFVPHGIPDSADIDQVSGRPKTYAWWANQLLASLYHPRSKGAVIEMPGLEEVDADDTPGQFKQLMADVKTLDMGDRAQSMREMREKLRYWDEKIGEGLFRGARTLFPTQGGTKADSEKHSENAQPDEEGIDNMLVKQINDGPVRIGLTLNFGPDILKVVRGISSSPLIARERINASEFVRLMLQNTQTALPAMSFMDGEQLFRTAGIKTVGNWVDVISKATAAQDAQQTSPGSPSSNSSSTTTTPPTNGNGRASATSRAT